jgi:segregation and condensation protein A
MLARGQARRALAPPATAAEQRRLPSPDRHARIEDRLRRAGAGATADRGFSGPLELLLHLLGDGRVAITTIPVASVADQYLAFVRLLPADAPRLDFLAEFLVVAAQLLVLKSRTLLPRGAARDEAEALDEAALEERLREYRRYRRAAADLGQRQARGQRAFARLAPPPLPPAPPPRLTQAAPERLAAALDRLLASRPSEPTPAPAPRMTIAVQIARIRRALAEWGRVSFQALGEECSTRGELVVTFLAILELCRAQAVVLEQADLFGDIWIVAAPAAPPAPAAQPPSRPARRHVPPAAARDPLAGRQLHG